MESALLWYGIYSKTLKAQGFLINPYHRCIANSNIQENLCTIVWYVDDNKVSHVDEEVNTKVFETTSENFGNLTVSRGKKHKFLGMDIEFLSYGKLSFFMKDYIDESIDLFGEELSTKVSSPAKKVRQNIDERSTRPEKKDADIFHSIVAKLLLLSKRGRPDIEPAISILCTRVTKSTKEDKAK